MRWVGVLVVASLVACSFERGTQGAPGDDARPDDSGVDSLPSEGGTPGGINYVSHTFGKSTNGTVTVASTAMAGATYVLGIASKPHETVATVTGLGATWRKLGDQCGARSQTGVALYVGRGATSSGNVVVTMAMDPDNTVAIVAIYSGSNNTGAVETYNALDASTCDSSNTSVDISAYAFAIGATHRVVSAVATRQMVHMPGAGLVQRVQEMQGSSGDAAGLAIVDGLVTMVAGTLSSEVDVAAIAVDLQP